MKFAQRLREARGAANMSGTDVAKEVGVSRNYIYDIETAKKRPSLDLVFRLAMVYCDGSIIPEFLEINPMFDGKLDPLFRVVAALLSDVLDYEMDRFNRILEIIETDPEGKQDYYDFVESFLAKYEKPDA